ncbi:S1 RNA-binding domain-containing protein [Novisyntrophococcus fermenticellae]|uniref:S1 RNA-binding domain-containing protein n=1 Tax=Novisyntrophococcus fermenticellae TaxID=2068655 RepID=UPI002E799038|nr:S1 RNA-binding domain-containing protein [Novisyntrophococcus fermenticellae]
MTDENMTMDDFSKAVDRSFDSFKDEDQMAWENLKQLKEAKTILNVTVDGIVNKGVVSYVEGIRGFIPASKLSLEHIDDFNDYLGKEIQVQVFDIDEEKNRLILSCREILRAKADEERRSKIDAITIGSVMDGTVESIQPYGAFINLGERLSGLVHISQISNTRIKDPSVVLSVGDPVKVKVIAIKDGKLSLSIKALNEDAEKAEQAELKNIKIPKSEELTTNLGSLFKNIKL